MLAQLTVVDVSKKSVPKTFIGPLKNVGAVFGVFQKALSKQRFRYKTVCIYLVCYAAVFSIQFSRVLFKRVTFFTSCYVLFGAFAVLYDLRHRHTNDLNNNDNNKNQSIPGIASRFCSPGGSSNLQFHALTGGWITVFPCSGGQGPHLVPGTGC